jgi:hypothetical protein
MEHKGSLPYSQQPSTCPWPQSRGSVQCRRLVKCSVTWYFLYGEEILSPRPTPKVEDYPLSAVYDCWFSVWSVFLTNTLNAHRLSTNSCFTRFFNLFRSIYAVDIKNWPLQELSHVFLRDCWLDLRLCEWLFVVWSAVWFPWQRRLEVLNGSSNY